MSRPYLEVMVMSPAVTYTPCATSFRELTWVIITFAQFEEGDLLSEFCNGEESGDEPEGDSIMPKLLSKEEIDTMDSGDDSDHNLIST